MPPADTRAVTRPPSGATATLRVAGWLIGTLLCLWTLPVAAQTALSPAEARTLAVLLADDGQEEEAAALAAALLDRDPADATAWIVLSRVRRAAGDVEGAFEAARRAGTHAASGEERFAAAMERAAAHFALNRGLMAQFWLRQAVQTAPSPDHRVLAVRSLRAVQQRTPVSMTLGFDVAPTSNVNNGSRADTVTIGGLPFVLSGDARALSGVVATLSGTVRYRFAGLGGRPAEVSLAASMQEVRLSDAARRQAPMARASDYAIDTFQIGVTQIVSAPPDGALIRFDARFGQTWYGGTPLLRFARAGLHADWDLGPRGQGGLSGSVERQLRQDDEARSAWVLQLDATRSWATGHRGGDVILGVGVRRVASQSIDTANTAVFASLDYVSGTPVLGPLTVGLGLDVEYRDHAASSFGPDGRRDSRIGAHLTLGRPDWNLYGFSPTVTFEISRTRSNISLYEASQAGVRLGLVSIF